MIYARFKEKQILDMFEDFLGFCSIGKACLPEIPRRKRQTDK